MLKMSAISIWIRDILIALEIGGLNALHFL